MTTAIYSNRLADKQELEAKTGLSEEGNDSQEFRIETDGPIFAKGYLRIVYGDHGPYIEFDRKHIKLNLKSKFNNPIDYDNIPGLDFKYYYFWLFPISFPNVKVYLQIKPVDDLPNAPKRADGKKSSFKRKEGYADYRRGLFYVDPNDLNVIQLKDCEKL